MTNTLSAMDFFSAKLAYEMAPEDLDLAREMFRQLMAIDTTHVKGSTVAAETIRGWLLRVLSLLVALASAAAAYPAIAQWVVPDVSARAAELAGIPVMFLVGSERRYGGAVLALIAAVLALVAAAILMRAASRAGGGAVTSDKYLAPSARRSAARSAAAPAQADDAADGSEASERRLWDALDDGQDPTAEGR